MNDFALEQIEKDMRVQDIFARRCIKAAVFGHCAVGVRMNHRKFGNDAMIDRKDSATDRLTLCVLVLALLKY